MIQAGGSRRRIARRLNSAYAGGLLSEETFAHRIDDLLTSRLVDPFALVGDLNLRRLPPSWARFGIRVRSRLARFTGSAFPSSGVVLLALDWDGGRGELTVGRHAGCDLVMDNPTVSRRHARLKFRDGKWIVHDLQSKNGTFVNGAPVGRCELRPGDELCLGEERLTID